MTTQHNGSTHQQKPVSAAKPMLIGAAVGLALITFFLVGAGDQNHEWGKYWRIKPLLMVPFAGAMGGLFYYIMHYLSYHRGLNKTIAVILSVIVFAIGIWMGTVLGLNGTMWN